MTGLAAEESVINGAEVVEGKTFIALDEKPNATAKSRLVTAAPADQVGSENREHESFSDNVIIRTGADAARHLLPLRDYFEPVLTFRSLFIATSIAAFQAVMSQIYQVCSHACTVTCQSC